MKEFIGLLNAYPMKDWAELLHAIAHLLWPLVALIIALVFRGAIIGLAQRLKRGKLFGQELELEKSLEELQTKAVASATQVFITPTSSNQPSEDRRTIDASEKILNLASSSPTAGLMQLSAEIERELRQFTASGGHHVRLDLRNPRRIAEYWHQKGLLPNIVVASANSFFDVRNQIVHGHKAEAENVLRAIDSGITILKTLQALPHEVNTVYHPGVEVYSDKECKQKREDVKGIILETTSPGGTVKSYRIFPTKRTDYQKGKLVAWEWDLNHTWGPSWYRDPDTGEIKDAWGQSAEFVGRHLEDF